ncbi:hypothetical protein M8997_020680 [Phyllobacterium sp. 21LDTY02-6]|uniref:hypothetical protein n=1 Tax=unclassified Phyllobacterium TaxID=2638441 RepID=UPI0020225137|nr:MULTISPECIES: hypothetical protein [unclassified Phyllobacterium]MCO4319607.1 hypothetical protein [Phyllobacterium sp. 21LDTY02-6]MCX8280351.1 hypothetical protein [Phyllobacterium sp. 0TCS1.6C]MCX8295200.1 hypothetical protein [Phyllobacterium sp. 0TCS1.6A]
MMVAVGLAWLGATLPAALAATNDCAGVRLDLTKARKQAYAPLVAAAVGNKVKPAKVEFNAILESGDWSAAYVSTPIADDGMMFFQTVNSKKQFRDVWGGFADESDRPDLIKWARKLGAPDKLARCFAQVVID